MQRLQSGDQQLDAFEPETLGGTSGVLARGGNRVNEDCHHPAQDKRHAPIRSYKWKVLHRPVSARFSAIVSPWD